MSTARRLFAAGRRGAVGRLALGPAWGFDFSDHATLFVDAARTTAVSADGDPIGWARDLSGGGLHVSASAAARPTWRAGVTYGLGVARFDGTDDALAFAAPQAHTAGTMVVVANDRTGAPNDEAYYSQANLSLYANNAAVGCWGTFANPAFLSSGVSASATFRLLIAVVRAFNDIDLVTDGVAVTRTTGTGWPGRAGAARIGSDTGGGQWLSGDIGEAWFYSRALAAAERSALQACLKAKWGIP